MHTNANPAFAALGLALLSALPSAHAAGLYPKNSAVLQVDGKNYDRLVAKSNYTTILEFYAPWCGHCKNLQPAYEKAAKNLEGLANVAAINCDEESNKAFCGQFGVQGFPTLKIVRPGKKYGKPVVDDYNGPRTAKDIVNGVVDKINNHVKKVTDNDVDSWLSEKNETAKAVLFTDKGTTSALLKSVAIDFLDVIPVAQIRSKEAKAVEIFGVDKFPTLVLLPGGDKPAVVYDGEMKKGALVKFLSQAGTPNPGPAAEKPKAAKKDKKDAKKETKKEANKEKPSKSTSKTSSSTTAAAEEETSTVSVETPEATNTVEATPPIPALADDKLAASCLTSKSGISILAVVPAAHGETAEKALSSLAEIAFKHSRGKRNLFPFYEVHSEGAGTTALAKALEVSGEVEIVAINGKRSWWRHYEGDFSLESVESWIDAIRLSEGVKNKLPEGVIVAATEEKKPEETVEVKVSEDIKIEIDTEPESKSFQGAEPTPEPTETPEHERDEL